MIVLYSRDDEGLDFLAQKSPQSHFSFMTAGQYWLGIAKPTTN